MVAQQYHRIREESNGKVKKEHVSVASVTGRLKRTALMQPLRIGSLKSHKVYAKYAARPPKTQAFLKQPPEDFLGHIGFLNWSNPENYFSLS